MFRRLAASALPLLAASAAAQTFAPPEQHVMGPWPCAMVSTDLSGDGLLDVATLDADNSIAVRLGDGAGGFGSVTTYAMPTGLAGTYDLVGGDVDGDGRPDLVVSALVALTAKTEVGVLRGLGGGAFGQPVVYEGWWHFAHMLLVRLADLDGDGDLDVVAGTNDSWLFFLGNDGTGAFTPWQSLYTLPYPCPELDCLDQQTSLVPADTDLDGDIDLGITAIYLHNFDILSNAGTGTFTTTLHKQMDPGFASLTFVDADEDGAADALACDGYYGVEFMAGDGTGQFADPVVSLVHKSLGPFTTGIGSLAVADLDGDGHLDVAGIHDLGSQHDLLYARGDASGSFGPQSETALATSACVLTAADVDRDGRADLLTTNHDSATDGTISLFRNTTEPEAPWTDLGFALPGATGTPHLLPAGPLTAGSDLTLALTGALPGAPAVLVVGTSIAQLPVKSGVLVPAPDVLLAGFVVETDGGLTLLGSWPATSAGIEIAAQWWVADAGGPSGFTASNGIDAVTP